MVNITVVSVASMRIIPAKTRPLFFSLILAIAVIATIGNILALKSVLGRNIKSLQKVSIVSLAVADIMCALIFATNNLESLSKDMKTWSLGEFLCYFIPMGQVLCTTMSSFSLFVIALDRYQNLNSAVGQHWNLNTSKSVFIIMVLWITSAATSSPMLWMFSFLPVLIVYTDRIEPEFVRADVCISIKKEQLCFYYIMMACLIFFPLVLTFTWFYYNIAAIVWKHRTPQTSVHVEESSTKEHCSKEQSFTSDSGPNQNSRKHNPVKNVRLEKKIRTFKIIIVLLSTFVLCRLPYWIFFVIKLAKDIPTNTAWDVHYTSIILNLMNCALNPFLYTFLNQSISALDAIKQLIHKLFSFCCCFTNSDFDDFADYNPFEQEKEKEIRKKTKSGGSKNSCHLPCVSIHVTPKK